MGRLRKVLAIGATVAIVTGLIWYDASRTKPERSEQGEEEFAEELAEELQESRERFDEPQAAQEFFALKRSPDVTLRRGRKPKVAPFDAQQWVTAQARAATLPRHDSSVAAATGADVTANDFGGSWQALGPGNIGGRTRSLVIDPTTPNTMYAGSVAGGVWKSLDGGASWAPQDDSMANLAVSALAITPGTPQTLYAGTGEGYFNSDAVRGAGIFKTTNGGGTWTQLASTAISDFNYVNDIVVSSLSPSRLYAATRLGVYRSLDSGATWSQVQNASSVFGCSDLAIRTDAGATDRIFASCGVSTNTSAILTIYRNTDAGGAGTWDAVYSNSNFGRTSLAIAPSNQDTVYALAMSLVTGPGGNFKNGLGAVLRTTTGGASGSWTVRVDNTSASPLNTVLLSNPPFALACPSFGTATWLNQGWYDNVIAVDPADPDRVWTGAIDLFRSDDGGANFGIASYWYKDPADGRYAHADNHAITFHPDYNGTSNKTMFVGSDGGMFKTVDARAATATGLTGPCDATTTSATAWSNLNNGYQVTQFYDGTPFPNGSTYFGGTQDNGTLQGTTAGGTNGWTRTFGGDGGYVAVDPTNTNVQFLETTRLSIRKSTNGGASFASATSGITGDSGFLFISPFHMSKANPQVLFNGGFYIWRTTNQAASWTRASAVTPGFGAVSSVTTAPGDVNRALVGMSDGFILRSSTALTDNSTTLWPNIQPRAGYVSSVTFSPTDTSVAYATYSTFGGGAHVWRTADGGATWTGRDGTGPGTLPDIPAHSIAINPDNPTHLYLGTDLGVFVSLDEGLTWARENSGYANVITEKLVIDKVGGVNTLFAFTHGRSVWKVPLAGIPSTSFSTTSTQQYTLQNSDGATWVPIDAANLTQRFVPAASGSAVAVGNADLWTWDPGFNQDIALFVSDNGGAYTLAAWKESGGFAGTFSPNAAAVQAVIPVAAGRTYDVQLRWKTNKPGTSKISAGAGPFNALFSPTSINTQLLPAASVVSTVSTQQYTLPNSDGSTWLVIDPALTQTVAASSNFSAVVVANADLWTWDATFNQDIALFVSDNGGPFTLAAWKESGGFAGTFSPNAAAVQAMVPMVSGRTYTMQLRWKSNKAGTSKISAGAGPIGGAFSPTSISTQLLAPASVFSAVSTQQYSLQDSDGLTWSALDAANLTANVVATQTCKAAIVANSDLWTWNAEFNQDIGLFVSDNGGPYTLAAWKESGGFAGTFSPNAAAVQAQVFMVAGNTYNIQLRWKTNKPGSSKISAGAGPINGAFSPTSIVGQLKDCI